jgi:hypothetical protein
MSAPGIDSRLLEVLGRASSMELFQLNSVIDRMLADPKRIVQIRKDQHLGQTVRFMDWRSGQMRTGKVLALKNLQATILEDATRNSWSVPYAATEQPMPTAKPATAPEPQRLPLRREGDLRGQVPQHPGGAPSCASTSEPPPSIPVTGQPGEWASTCCAISSTSELASDLVKRAVAPS